MTEGIEQDGRLGGWSRRGRPGSPPGVACAGLVPAITALQAPSQLGPRLESRDSLTMLMRHHEAVPTPPQLAEAPAHEHPGWAFHGVVGLGMAGFLYAVSLPGIGFFLAGACAVTLLAAAVLWLVQAIGFGTARRRGEETGRGLGLLVAPICAVLLITLVWVDAPLRLRWAAGRPAFDRVVKAVDDGRSAKEPLPSGRIGLYRISHIDRVPNGLIFYEKTGNLFDDAGFAYLPDGPSPSLATGSFENPQWRALGNHWYAWTASW